MLVAIKIKMKYLKNNYINVELAKSIYVQYVSQNTIKIMSNRL